MYCAESQPISFVTLVTISTTLSTVLIQMSVMFNTYFDNKFIKLKLLLQVEIFVSLPTSQNLFRIILPHRTQLFISNKGLNYIDYLPNLQRNIKYHTYIPLN